MRNVRNEGSAYVHGLYPFPKVDQYNRKQFFSLVYIYIVSQMNLVGVESKVFLLKGVPFLPRRFVSVSHFILGKTVFRNYGPSSKSP